jgi:hypothetical protein
MTEKVGSLGWVLLMYVPYCNDLSHCLSTIKNEVSRGYGFGKSRKVEGADVTM